MEDKVAQLWSYCEQLKITWVHYLSTFFGIIFLRIFLENYSSPHLSGDYTSVLTTFAHYPSFYAAVFLSLNLIIYFFTRKKVQDILKISLLFSPVLLLPPLFDLVITQGRGWQLAYIFQGFPELIFSFFTFFGNLYDPGISLGMRVEVLLILIGLFVFIYYQKKQLVNAFFAAFITYCVFYIYFALPSFSSKLMQLGTLIYQEELNLVMARIFWLIIVAQVLLLWYFTQPKIFKAWMKNLRWERIIYYCSIAGLGIYYAGGLTGDYLSLIICALVLAINFWLAVGVNDLADIKGDRISNPERPLVKEKISTAEQKFINLGLFFFLITGALLLNYLVFILMLLYQFIYYIYSAPPLRLKRCLGISSVLVGLNAVLVFMAGFFLVSELEFHDFPMAMFWLLLIIYSLIVNVKDIKDEAGDKADHIKTIITVFGLIKGKKIIAYLSILALLLVALAVHYWLIYLFSLVFAGIIYRLITRKNYQESKLFQAYFVYFIGLLLFLVIHRL